MVLAVLLIAGGGIFAASELGGEVVVLTTQDASGAPRETRLWVVDDAGSMWLRAGQARNAWLRRLQANPSVRVERAGQVGNYRAVPVAEDAARLRVHELMAEKYGWADHLIGLIRDGAASIAVRLDPAEAPPQSTD